jgi:hypothetical protein
VIISSRSPGQWRPAVSGASQVRQHRAQTPSTSAPSAEHKLNLTQQQKQEIMQGLTSQKAESSTGGPEVRVGAKLPNTMMPHPMPSNVTAQVPDTKNFEFVKLSDKILLVDPANKMIAEMVPLSSRIGAGTPARFSRCAFPPAPCGGALGFDRLVGPRLDVVGPVGLLLAGLGLPEGSPWLVTLSASPSISIRCRGSSRGA